MNREQRLHPENQAYGQQEYEDLIDEIATTRLQKVRQYGPELQQIEEWEEASLMIYANMGRKWRRMKRLLWDLPFRERRKPSAEERYGLREALLDMANYCLYGVQMLDRLLPAPPKMSPFAIEQVAIHTTDPYQLRDLLHGVFGANSWSNDYVKAEGNVFGEPAKNEAELNFNYQMGNFEFEILSYVKGDNWLNTNKEDIGLSHLGVHVEDMDMVKEKMANLGYNIAQEVRTQSHTNPAIRDSRRYWYVIYDTRAYLGFDLKFIKRLSL